MVCPDEPRCVVCRRRRETPVCDPCKARMSDQVKWLPEALDALSYALMPSPGGGEKVTASRTPPLPVALDALSLRVGGSDDVREFASDQVGVLPIRAWLRAWALDWRRYLGHSLAERPPVRVRPGQAAAARPAQSAAERLGVGPALDPASRPDDPLAAEWDARRGAARENLSVRADVQYLTNWLDEACERYPYVADYAASLRGLVGATRAALGDVSSLEYLGRCPEDVRDSRTGQTTTCGAGIWHDPYVDRIVCPRCRTETPDSRRIWLARRMLDTWPIDRRRRYPRGLIEIIALPQCVTCGEVVSVDWIDATERSDSERFWRPGEVRCRTGCEQVERL